MQWECTKATEGSVSDGKQSKASFTRLFISIEHLFTAAIRLLASFLLLLRRFLLLLLWRRSSLRLRNLRYRFSGLLRCFLRGFELKIFLVDLRFALLLQGCGHAFSFSTKLFTLTCVLSTLICCTFLARSSFSFSSRWCFWKPIKKDILRIFFLRLLGTFSSNLFLHALLSRFDLFSNTHKSLK